MNDGPIPTSVLPRSTLFPESEYGPAILLELEREPGSSTAELAAACDLHVRTVHAYLTSIGDCVRCTPLRDRVSGGHVNTWRLLRRPAHAAKADRRVSKNAARILTAYARATGFTAGEVSERFGMSKGRACQVVRALTDTGRLEQIEAPGRRTYRVVRDAE
jgi:hypothetical protein